MDLNFLLWQKGGGYTTSLRSGGAGMKGRTGRSGFGTGVARKMLVFGFVQDIYELELWRKMWPHNPPPVVEYWKRQVRACVFSFFFFLSFSSFVPSGERWETGQRRIALAPKVRLLFLMLASGKN